MNDTRIAILAISIVIPLTAFMLSFSDQSKTTSLAEEKQIKVLVSFYPLYEFTKEISKERIDVSIITPAGIEPHDWEPTIQDLQKVQNTDMIVINGAGFESWLDDFVTSNPNVLVVDTSKDIELMDSSKFYFENNGSHKDPHIWLDPILAKKQVQNIANGLMHIDPEHTQYYQENADAYNTKLDLLDNKIRTELSVCSKKDFIAFHDAFSYFAKEYNLNQHTIVGVDANAEPTAVTLQQIIQKAKSLDLDIIFTEEAVNPRISEVIADEIDGKVLVLSPIEIADKNSDYIQKMEQNLLNLKEELCP
ncbi:MAG: zinc ABC transporter substrate-binding protein [Nitrosopumilaceae archaeon]